MAGFFHAIPVFLLAFLAGSGAASGDSPPAGRETAGFIHGRLTLRSGEVHEGFLRWGDEEAFWDDLFHSRQSELPWLEFVDPAELQAERRRQYFENHGLLDRLRWTMHNKGNEPGISRLFICRFGHLDAIEIDEEENVTAVIRGGRRVPVHGYANDVDSDLTVYPAAGDPVEVAWDDLASIAFFEAPAGAAPYAQRLYGTVESTEGSFEGFIQWDQSECTTTDILDGNDRDVPLGEIRSISKNRANEADIVLKDGSSFSMAGTNDVNGGNRGIMVENPAFGRVTVAWKRFVSATFNQGEGSGSGRDAFPAVTALQGSVTGVAGETWSGRIVYDLDAAWTCDIFNGSLKDLDFDIPFALIASIEKRDDETCRVRLASGRTLDLGDSRDTGRKHDGLLVFAPGVDTPTYLPWSKVAAVTFEDRD